MRRLAAAVALVATALIAAPAHAAPPRAPAGWPQDHVAIGVSAQPGERAGRARGIEARYQYLTGGLGDAGWSTWNPGGSFVTRYLAESRRRRSVFTYYQLLRSASTGLGEAEQDLANLRDPGVMRRYWADLALAFRRAAPGGRRVTVHVEPDLWGYVQQVARDDDPSTVPAAVASSGDPALAGLPDTAAGAAQAVVRLRDRLAPKARIAWHLSTWGSGTDPTFAKPSLARMRALGRRQAAFYRRFGARFDLVFADTADRDAGYGEVVEGDGGKTRWAAADYRRDAAYLQAFTRAARAPVVLWQLPLGNSGLPNTNGRYRDSRVQWYLGAGRARHLRALRRAGVVGLLFGAGADGNTTPESDGGLFLRLVKRYAARGAGGRR